MGGAELTLHVGYSDVSPGVGTRHLESPEEIQMYCSDSEQIELQAKLLNYFLGSNKSNINQYTYVPCGV